MEFVSQQPPRNQKSNLNSSSSFSSSRLISKQSIIDPIERNVRFQEEEQPEVETLPTGQQQRQRTIIKTPYKINNTQEKLLLAESRKSPKLANNKTHRVVEIKKFDAGTSIISSEKQEYLNENSPRPVSNQSHVSVKTSNAAQTRWPQKVIKKKDIEAKPWYLWSFEETVELYLGDEIRAEKYPKYNKSFVTKLKDPERDLKQRHQQNQSTTPGSTKSRSNSIASTVIAPFSPQGSVTSGKSISRKGTTPSSSKNSTPPHNPSNNNNNSESIREQKIIQAVKTKKLKISELKKQIELANHQIEVITRTAQEEHNKIQQIISGTELSNENLDYLKLKISTLLNKTKLSIQELIHQNSDNQEAMMQLQSDIKTWEKDNHSKLFQRTNLAKMEKQIKIEQHRLRLKFKIRNNLIVFSQLMKKHRYNPSFLYQLQYSSTTQSYSNNNNSNTNSPVRSGTMAFGKSLQQKMNQRKSVL
jgi:hypothetical protein